ncbi:hypothetical protein DRJ00_02905 [Candidatus Aerophobetes bacterium]|mgnify:CR=1 FL=1|uniref:Sialidase domain-containing protein n=1 Tax=Aerophobetes bacterium TaxID=2030807 RepID=A0A497E4U1_UNCAE|nr:MAG: hypothetical protein DRJ00_02905 [Candidatus Aerophobetes bacterium]
MLKREALPAIRPSAHSVNVMEYTDGRLLVTWFSGSVEGSEDQIGVGCILEPEEGRWSEPMIMMRSFEYEGERWVTEQICPIETKAGKTVVYTWASPFSSFRMRRRGDTCYWIRSIPESCPFRFLWDGRKARNLECLSGCAGLPKRGVVFQGKPMLRDPEAGPAGGWIIPYHTETEELMFHSRFLFVDSDGLDLETTATDLYQPPGCLEPSLARLDKDRWLCYMRYGKRGEGYIWRSESKDGGRTFTRPTLTNLRNPHSAVDIAFDAKGGCLLIAYNDSHSLRTPLTIGISDDEGRTFRTQDVETEAGEYSYPKLYQTRDGLWHLFYTHNRTHIEHVLFDVEWLLEGRKVIGLR